MMHKDLQGSYNTFAAFVLDRPIVIISGCKHEWFTLCVLKTLNIINWNIVSFLLASPASVLFLVSVGERDHGQQGSFSSSADNLF